MNSADSTNSNSEATDKDAVRRMLLILSKATLDNVYACFILANGREDGRDRSGDLLHVLWSRGDQQEEDGASAHRDGRQSGDAHSHDARWLARHGVVRDDDDEAAKWTSSTFPVLASSWRSSPRRESSSGPRKLAMEMFHLKQEDLFDDVDGVLTVGGFYERARTKGSHLLFI
ncbi:MAG: hypothetical protein R3B96_12405 [Pirellulaceae bacterium]